MFWKKEISSKEYADVLSRIGALRADIETLKYQVEKHELRISTAKRRDKADAESGDIVTDAKAEIEKYLKDNGFV